MARRRVCFVLPSLNGGGAERAAVQILNALDPTIWDRSMYLFERTGAYLDAVDPTVDLISAPSPGRVARWTGLRQFVKRARPQLIMVFLSYFSALSAARAARTGTRVVFNQQTPMSDFLSDADYAWRGRWHRAALSLATRVGYRFADAIVATSNGVADDLATRFGVSRGRIRVLHNPVDLQMVSTAACEPLDPAQAWRGEGPRIVAAGRLADAKNYPLLVDAFALVRREIPAQLLILGEGERDASIRVHAARLGVDGSIAFGGFQRNPWKFIARAEVFALSSRYEGFGNVLVESMACGVPVVATGSPGTRDIVVDAVNGLLVEPHEPSALAAALLRVLRDASLRARMSAAAVKTSERFALPVVATAYDRVLAEVIA